MPTPTVDSILSKPKGEKSESKEPEKKSSEHKEGKHKKHEMHIRKADDNHSYIIEHHGDGEMKEHTAADLDALHDHLESHEGAPNEGEEAPAMPAPGGMPDPTVGGGAPPDPNAGAPPPAAGA